MTGSIWVRRGTFNWEGLAVVILLFAGLGGVLVAVAHIVSPTYVCIAYKDVDVIEETTLGVQAVQIVVTKSVCTKWEKNHE